MGNVCMPATSGTRSGLCCGFMGLDKECCFVVSDNSRISKALL